jgi:L-lactate utilization protein LutB
MAVQLREKDRELLNEQLKELHDIKEDLKRAKSAKVENLDPIIERCDQCLERVKAFKRVYFPDKS